MDSNKRRKQKEKRDREPDLLLDIVYESLESSDIPIAYLVNLGLGRGEGKKEKLPKNIRESERYVTSEEYRRIFAEITETKSRPSISLGENKKQSRIGKL